MTATQVTGGHPLIYQNLLTRLASADIALSASHLGLALNDNGEAGVPFFGRIYLVSGKGVRRKDGRGFPDAVGSVLIHYILQASRSRPGGTFVTFAQLAGPVFKPGSYSQSALERPIIKRFQTRVPDLEAVVASVGGRREGQAGLGAVSLVVDLLPHIPMQLIFYDRDDEFPARTTLLFDRNATQVLDFEVLAVLVTLFVQCLANAPAGVAEKTRPLDGCGTDSTPGNRPLSG